MKYRVLTDTELGFLEEEFVQFLIVNGIDGGVWEKMNRENPDNALKMVELFSDAVLQKVYEKIQFLEFRSDDSCLVFECAPQCMNMISIVRKSDSSVSLATPESIHQALCHRPEELACFRSEKPYTTLRENEIHSMLENGCVLSTNEFWALLNQVIPN